MVRKTISPKKQGEVLVRSRRRCCICFGLDRDTSIKQGQIAHLDHDSSNDAAGNLAFICFNHHDQYDGKTRQSKNFTYEEVVRYREELYDAIRRAFAVQVAFGNAKADPIAGHYIRTSDVDSADLTITHVDNETYHVKGFALWGTDRAHGPNLGGLDFLAEFSGDTLKYTSGHNPDKPFHISLKFTEHSVSVKEENWEGMYGLNVMFGGEYEKAT